MTNIELAAALDDFCRDAMLPELDRANIAQAAEALRRAAPIEDAAREAEAVLARCTTRDFSAPEDTQVRDLGERIGFGALMDAASKGWRDVLVARYGESAAGSQFTCGPCEVTVKKTLTMLRSALGLAEE